MPWPTASTISVLGVVVVKLSNLVCPKLLTFGVVGVPWQLAEVCGQGVEAGGLRRWRRCR